MQNSVDRMKCSSPAHVPQEFHPERKEEITHPGIIQFTLAKYERVGFSLAEMSFVGLFQSVVV